MEQKQKHAEQSKPQTCGKAVKIIACSTNFFSNAYAQYEECSSSSRNNNSNNTNNNNNNNIRADKSKAETTTQERESALAKRRKERLTRSLARSVTHAQTLPLLLQRSRKRQGIITFMRCT